MNHNKKKRGMGMARRDTAPGGGAMAVGLPAILMVAVLLATAFVPAGTDSDGATTWSESNSWKVVLHTETVDGCEQLTVHLYKNGNEVTDLRSIAKDTSVSDSAAYTSSEKNSDGSRKNVGSWAFDDSGFGPFNSFYAAFDPSNGNRMVCHLDPNDLNRSIGGQTSVTVDGKNVKISDCNIMWCIPTVWWGTNADGDLVMASSKLNDEMEAYAHTVGGTTYEHLAIGVYESSTKIVNGKTALTSQSGTVPKAYENRATFREYANNQTVSVDGKDTGHAMLWNFYQYELYKYCALAVMGSWDSQTVAGNGKIVTTNEYYLTTGLLDSSGPYAGSRGSVDDQPVKVFLENVWGSIYDAVDGFVYDGGTGYYIDTSSVPTDSTTAGGNVIRVTTSLPQTNGYVSDPSSDVHIWGMPTAVNGSETTGLYDYIMTSTSKHPLFVGGSSGTSSGRGNGACGISAFLHHNPLSSGYVDVTGRLAFMFGADITGSVTYDHSALKEILEEYQYDPSLADDLPQGIDMQGRESYEQLSDIPDAKGFRHVGWIIDGEEYPATHSFVKRTDHIAKSVWVGLPAVTYDHSQLADVTGNPGSVSGLSNGFAIKDHDRYEQLPDRGDYIHIGWRVELDGKTVDVGPTAPLVTRNSHTAVSLWTATPTVVLDHHELLDVVGEGSDKTSGLPTSLVISENKGYIQLDDTAGYRHVGWRIGDVTVGPTAEFVTTESHTAVSLWEKIPDEDGFVPMPDDGRWDDGGFLPQGKDDPEPGWLGDSRNILIIAIVAAVIAELAVLAASRRR